MSDKQPTPSQIRAGMGMLNWEYKDLSRESGLTIDALSRICLEKNEATERSRAKIRGAFERAGLEFLPNGVKAIDDMVRVLEGGDAYIQMLSDVLAVTAVKGGEVLFLFSDDRTACEGEIDMEARIRANGVKFRVLIEEGNPVYRWTPDEYRQIPSQYFNHDLQVVYGDKVAQVIAGGQKIMIVNNPSFAASARNLFNMLWPTMLELPKDAQHAQ